LIHSLATVVCPAIICSHSPFKRKARPDWMCAIVSEMWAMGQFDWLGAPVGALCL
jgi:hypothetical protein